jgi:hypothetical protein
MHWLVLVSVYWYQKDFVGPVIDCPVKVVEQEQ